MEQFSFPFSLPSFFLSEEDFSVRTENILGIPSEDFQGGEHKRSSSKAALVVLV